MKFETTVTALCINRGSKTLALSSNNDKVCPPYHSSILMAGVSRYLKTTSEIPLAQVNKGRVPKWHRAKKYRKLLKKYKLRNAHSQRGSKLSVLNSTSRKYIVFNVFLPTY